MSADKRVSEGIDKAWAEYAQGVHINKDTQPYMKNCFYSGFKRGMKWRDEQEQVYFKKTMEYVRSQFENPSEKTFEEYWQEFKNEGLVK